MRRIILVVTVALVMAAMMGVMAAPGFAQAIHESGPGSVGGQTCEGKLVHTPSDNTNVQCKVKPEGGNKGGSGGGGATVAEGPGSVDNPEGGEPIPVEGHVVQTPSGNVNVQADSHPKQN